jgi:hypothetical protein
VRPSKEQITLQVQCTACNKTVTAYPLVNKDDLVAALKHKLDVRVCMSHLKKTTFGV